jgi:hypothetical protein
MPFRNERPLLVTALLVTVLPAAADPAAELESNLERARREAAAQGWQHQETLRLDGKHAALVRYDAQPGTPAFGDAVAGKQRVEAIAAGGFAPVAEEETMAEVARTPKGEIAWDLRGDGGTQVVITLTACGANCSPAGDVVLELGPGGWARAAGAPACPTCVHDDDSDGVPEFDRPLITLSLGGCPRVACGASYSLDVAAPGPEAWDGQAFSATRASFRRIYEQRLADAKKRGAEARRALLDARKAGRAPDDGLCPLGALEAAAKVYAYSRVLGTPKARALGGADAIMRGLSTEPCAEERMLFEPPPSWKDLRARLASAVLPVLEKPQTPARR